MKLKMGRRMNKKIAMNCISDGKGGTEECNEESSKLRTILGHNREMVSEKELPFCQFNVVLVLEDC